MRINPWLMKLLPSSAVVLLALCVLQPQSARAQSCETDPFGAEVCLPEINSNDDDDSRSENQDDPTRLVIVPPCFGPCTLFPPRAPYRAFERAPQAEPTPESIPEPTLMEDPVSEPVKPLWFKSDALDAEVAEVYLERTLRNHFLAQVSESSVNDTQAPIVTFNGVRYVEILEPNSLLESQETNDPGFNAWVRGFGGRSQGAASRHRTADFDGGGLQLGFDIPLGNTSRIGLFGTYANSYGKDGGRGSWATDGWGGGGYAEYWINNFYLRGMVSAGGFSGNHRRKQNGDTISGDRSGNSWTGVISLGAPFDSGDWILEPQALFSYTNTSLDKFNETRGNRNDRLRYSEMELDRFDTELSMKFAHPIRDGQRSLFMPFVRVGWVADWGQGGDSQKVSFINADRNENWNINGDSSHGALIELGLDYTTYNFNDTSMGVYARTGAVLWGGDRSTSWQVSGGLNFKF